MQEHETNYTEEEKITIVREFQTSTMNLDNYCKQYGIKTLTLTRWFTDYRNKRGTFSEKNTSITKIPNQHSFVKLPIESMSTPLHESPKSKSSVSILLKRGDWSIEVCEGFSSIALSQIVKVLEG